MLRALRLHNIGPADTMVFEPADRLNVITGDNGLGKSFLLDLAWWAVTRTWAAQPIRPSLESSGEAEVEVAFEAVSKQANLVIRYDRPNQSWRFPKVTKEGLQAHLTGPAALIAGTFMGDVLEIGMAGAHTFRDAFSPGLNAIPTVAVDDPPMASLFGLAPAFFPMVKGDAPALPATPSAGRRKKRRKRGRRRR